MPTIGQLTPVTTPATTDVFPSQQVGGATVSQTPAQIISTQRNVANGVAGTDASNNISAQTVLATGATTARALAAMAADCTKLEDFASYGLHRDGVRDDSACVGAALTYCMTVKTPLYITSGGPIVIANASLLPALSYVTIIGSGVIPYGLSSSSTNGIGSTFFITDTVNPVFRISVGVTFRGCNFFWPTQTEAACSANGGNPVAFPPLFSPTSSSISRVIFDSLVVINAYDFIVADASGDGVGDIVVSKCRIMALRDTLRIRNTSEVIQITDCLFSPEVYDYNMLSGPTYALLFWFSNNSNFIHAIGNGASDVTGNVVNVFGTNSYIYGHRTGIYADTGAAWVNLTNVGMDGIQQPWRCDPGGSIITSFHKNSVIFQYNSWSQITSQPSALLTMHPTSAPASTITTPAVLADNPTRQFDLDVEFPSCSLGGCAFNISGTGVYSVTIANSRLTSVQASVTFGYISNCPNAYTRISCNEFKPIAGAGQYVGVAVQASAGTVAIADNSFQYPLTCIDLTSASGALLDITNNSVISPYGQEIINPSTYLYNGVNFFQNTVDAVYKAGPFAAAGTTQATATPLGLSFCYINSGTGGVLLPSAMKGVVINVKNRTASAVNVYPAGSGQINSAGSGVAYSLGAGLDVFISTTALNYWLI